MASLVLTIPAGPLACFATVEKAADGWPPSESSSASSSPGSTTSGGGPRGCAVTGSPPPTAPNGYYVQGASVCTPDGQVHLFHGVDRPSLEWSPRGVSIGPSDFRGIASWNANVVRIALNQDFWLSGAALYDPGYPARVEQAVADAEAAGLDVILDLHWSDRGNLAVMTAGAPTKQDANGGSNQQQMADQNSVVFWSEVATTFKNDGRVLFELYNEPNAIPWSVWLGGGMSAGFEVAGMQQLYDAVRARGAENVVIAGGLEYAFDLSGVSANLIQGHNIMYATHPYDQSANGKNLWESRFGYLTTNDIAPVIATEFGDFRDQICTGDWDEQLIAFADAHQMSWTAWAWFAADDTCTFPALISDWSYTPTVQGVVVKAALMAYAQSGSSSSDAGSDGAVNAAVDGTVDAAVDGGVPDAADAN